MRGTLELIGPSGAVELRARVVRHRLDTGDRVSFHAYLSRYEGQHGTLRLDDNTSMEVRVFGGWLAVTPMGGPGRSDDFPTAAGEG
jgi:hypothetical protein